MKRLLLAVGLLALAAIAAFAFNAYRSDPARLTTPSEFEGLAREAADGVLHSAEKPQATIAVAGDYEYLGGQKFVLYGTAAVEQHFYGAKWPDGRTKAVLWLHFEEVLPGVDWAFDYSDAPRRLTVDDLDFFVDAEPGQVKGPFRHGKPGTDGHRARTYLAERGYEVPTDYVYVRAVHLPTEDRRSEMIVFHLTDLSPEDLTRTALLPGGEAADRWDDIADDRLAALADAVSIAPLD